MRKNKNGFLGRRFGKKPVGWVWNSIVILLMVIFLLGFSEWFLLMAVVLFILYLVLEIPSYFLDCLLKYLRTIKQVRWKHLSMFIFDLLTYALISMLFVWFATKLSNIIITFNTVMNSLNPRLSQDLAVALHSVKSAAIKGIFYLCVSYLGGLLVWSLGKGVVWSIAQSRKLSLRYLYRFFLLNLIYSIILFIALALIVSIFKPTIVVILLFLLLVYITLNIYAYFEHNILEAISFGFRSLSKLNLYIIPFIIGVIGYFLLMLILSPVSLLSVRVQTLIVVVITVLYLNYLRLYFLQLYRVTKKQIKIRS